MAYTAKDAVKTFLEYLEISETQITYIPETKKRGIIYNNTVIFISPVSYSEYNDKGFFDTRDSGAKERFITWSYARDKKLKYFCVAVQNSVDRYKDYIFSLECSEKQIQNCSGKVSYDERERTGTQVVIPRTFKPEKDFERILTEYGFYISASKRKTFLNYMNMFDNRPFENDIDNRTEWEKDLAELAHVEKNKEFAFKSLEILDKYHSLTRLTVQYLTDTDFCKKMSFYHPILYRVNDGITGKIEKRIDKYYPEIINIKSLNKNYLITDDWFGESERAHMTNNRKLYLEFLSKIIKENNMKSRNRIIFGAPGTGKSNKLEVESSDFTLQENIQTDIEQQIKEEITSVIKLSGKLNFLAAIGIKYSDQLKNKSKTQLQSIYNINSVDELYIGSRAKDMLSQIKVDEEEEDKEAQIKAHVEQAQSGTNMLQKLTAIGMKYSDYLSESSMPDLKKTYELKSDAQMWWLYRGAQAMQVINNETLKQPVKFMERVTFHPNYTYSQFVGTYKPIKSKLNQEEITYEYVPGPFMRVYTNAKKNTEKIFLLLIEEINRANVAAVFGDVFQLLDRNADGTSQYPITPSEDQKNYLESCGIDNTEISLPSNMYIWATMNSADQGVLPMDAAFKRRWDFEYIGIDDGEDSVKGYSLPIPHKNDDKNIVYTSINWNEIRKAINTKLKNISGVNEDKLLGPYFLSKSTLDDATSIDCTNDTEKASKFCSLFKSKILMYLYEDVVKMNPTELFNKSVFAEDKPLHYSDLCQKFDEIGLKIFDEDFIK